MTLLLSERDVDALLGMPAAMRAVEDVLRLQGEGRAHNLSRRRVGGGANTLHLMGAAIPSLDRIGFKAYVTGPAGARFVVNLYRDSTGELDAIIEAGRLGQLRTGAATGVSAKYLARVDADVAGVIGSGYQARTQLEAVAHSRKLTSARVFSRDADRRDEFARQMSDRLGLDVASVATAREASADADIIITATTSSQPVLLGDWIPPGAHVVAMGANRMQSRELDDAAIQSFDLIAVDDLEQAKLEAGDLCQPVERGLLKWDEVVTLGDVIAGKTPGRSYNTQITLFKSLGIALWDVAVAHHVYEAARRQGAGHEAHLGET